MEWGQGGGPGGTQGLDCSLYQVKIFPHGPTGMYASFSKGHGHQGIFFYDDMEWGRGGGQAGPKVWIVVQPS